MKNHYKVTVVVLLLFKCLPLFSNAYAKDVPVGGFPYKNKQEKSPQNASSKDNPVPKNLRKMDCGIPAPTIVNYGCLDLVWQKDYKLVNSNNVQTLESPKKIYPTNDGGYIFASNSQFQPSNSGDSEYAIFKVGANGNRLWSKTFGTVDKDFLTAFVPTSDGGYVLGGYSEGGINRDKTSASKGSNDIWLIKINANGTKVWDKSFGGADQDLLASMIATSDGGFLLGGYSSSGNNGDKTDPYIGGYYDAWILKIDGSGNKIWDKTFGGTGYDATRVVAETTDGYIIGTQSSSGIDGNKTSASKGNTDFWILKIDFNGTKIWDNSYGGSNVDIPQAINKNADGSLIISGYSNSPISGDKSQKSRGLDDIWILKINSSSVKVWDKTIGGSNREYVTSATTTLTGNIIFNVDSYSNISGDKKRTPVAPNTTDQWLFEITPDGVQLWEKYLNGNYGFLTGSGDLIVHNNHLISLGNTDYSIARQGDFWNIGLKKISYCNAQPITSTTICQGKCATLVAENCNSGVVKWSNGEYGASICASPPTTQNYKSVCLSADSLCVGDSSAVFTVNVTPSDAVSISPSGFVDITSCGTSQTITATGCVNGTISWSNGLTGNPITFVPTTNQAVKAICTMPNGCVSESDYLSLSVYPISFPYVSGVPTQGICPNTPVTLNGSGCSGGTLGWTGGLVGNSITINPSTTVTIKVACALPNGCVSDSVQSIITVIPKPITPTISNYSCLTKVWDKRFGGIDPEYFSKILKVSDGYLLAGTSRSANTGDKTDLNRGGNTNTVSKDYWIVKVDNNGNKVWDKTFGGIGDDNLTDIILLADGNFMLAGTSNSGIGGEKMEVSRGGTDYWIIKIDANGNKIWDKTYGGSGYEDGNIIIKETNDGFLLGGSTSSGISGDKTSSAIVNGIYHFWILKLNLQGIKVWDKSFGGSGTSGEVLKSIELLENNDFLLLGRSSSPANLTIGDKTSPNKGNSDYWLLKINSNGNKIWDRSYGGSSYDEPNSMIYTNDGKIIIAGTSSSSKSGDKSRGVIGNSDIWAIRIDTSGNKIWDKTYGGSGLEENPILNKTSQNTYIITANASLGSSKGYDKSENSKDAILFSYGDFWIMELNNSGEKLWDKTLGGTDTDYPNNVVIDNNSIIIGGTSFSGIGADKSQATRGVSDYWLVKMATCQPNIASSTTICKNDSTFLTAQGCPNASTVKWSNNETVQTISVKPSVTTTYKAVCISTDAGTCQSDSSLAFTVNVNTTTIPTITSSNTSICQSGGSVTLTASGCSGTYGWTGGATTSSISVSPVATKTYKLACTSNGCTSDSASVTITVAIPTKPILSASSSSICVGGIATITASGCTGGAYSWTGGLTGSSIIVSPIATKSFKAVCTVGTCVSDSSLVSTIMVNPIPSIPVINPPNPSTICAGNFVSLSVNNPLASATYRWTGGLTGTSISVSPASSKNYKVNVSLNNCASDSSTAVTVTVQPKPIVILTPSTTSPICVGQSVTITASGCSTGTYAWTGGLTGTSITVTPSVNRTYKSACLLNGCASDSASVSVTVSQSSPLPVTTASSVCQGSSLNAGNGLKSTAPNCSGGASNVTATYSGGTIGYDGGNSSGANPTATISGMSSTITKVRISITWQKKGGSGNAYSCASGTSTNPYHNETSFKIKAPDGITIIDLINNGTFDRGSTSSLVTTVFEDGFPTVSSSGPVSGTFSPASSLSGFNGKIPNGVWTLLPNDSGGGDPLCVSGFSVTVTTSGSPSTVTWWDAQTSGNQVGTGTEYLPTTSTLATGNYTYYAQASCLGLCPSARVGAVLTVNSRPNVPSITLNNSTICGGINTTLTASGCTGGTYAWTGGLTGSSVTVSPTVTKSYKVACTMNTCTSDSSSAAIITVTPKPNTPSISPTNTSICVGGSTTLTASGCAGGTYAWTGGLTGSSITVSMAKTYKVACTINTCVSDSSSTATVTISTTLPGFVISSNKSSICVGDTATLTATGCTGTLLWSNNLTTNVIKVTPLITTTYTATCSVGGCSFTQQISVSTTVAPNVTAPTTSLLCGQTITLTANNFPVGSTIQWRKDGIDIAGATSTTYSANSGGVFDFTSYSYQYTSTVGSGLYPNQVVAFTDKNIGFAGNNAGIFKTNDGGGSWTNVYNSSSRTVNSIFKISTNYWAVGEQGLSIKSIDGGNTWANTSINTSFPLKKISFRDLNNGAIVGDFGAIYYTINGGNTWTAVNTFNIANYPTFLSLSFVPNTTNVWAVGSKASNGFIAKSTDNGITWSETSLGIAQIPANTIFNDITFTTANNGFIVGDNGTIFKTTNGGVNWQLQSSPILSSLKSIQFLNSQVGYICGTFPNGSLLKTLDGGNTWKSLNISVYPVSLSFVDENTGWLTNYGSLIKYTAPQCPTTPITIINNCCQSPIPTIAPSNPTFCAGGNVTLTASGCAGTYTWTGGITGSSITVSVAKTYKVTCRMNNCNSDSASVSVTNNVVAPPTIALGGEVCTNTLPVKIWDKSISTPSGSSVNTLIKTNDGGMFTVIQEPSTTTIAKLDATGTIVWSRALFSVPAGTVKINVAVATVDGGYLLAGKSNSASVGGDVSTSARLGLYNNPTDDFWILKIDANGVKQWDKRYGGNYNDEANDIIKTSDGGYLLGGITQSEQGGDITESGTPMENNYWSVKIDANGLKQWDRRFIPQYLTSLSGGATLKAVQNTPDGGYLLGGYSKPAYEPINNNTQTNDYFVVKLNSSGAKQWEKLYNNNDEQDYLNSMQPTLDGGFLLVGITSASNENVWLVKINSSGVKQWDKQYGGSSNDNANTIIPVAGENNFLIGGSSSSGISGDKTEASRGMNDMWVIKIKPDGTKIWDKTIGGSGPDYLFKTTFDSNNDILLGGFTASPTSGERTGNGPGAWLVKIASNCPPQTSAFIMLGDSVTLKANNCTGTINWSNGQTGNSIIAKPIVNTSYTATCTNVCTSSPSSVFNVTVSTGICESIKSGSWDDPTTWSVNRVPLSTDDVIINIGHTVSTQANNIFAKTLNYRGGILQTQSGTNLKLGN